MRMFTELNINWHNGKNIKTFFNMTRSDTKRFNFFFVFCKVQFSIAVEIDSPCRVSLG